MAGGVWKVISKWQMGKKAIGNKQMEQRDIPIFHQEKQSASKHYLLNFPIAPPKPKCSGIFIIHH